MSAREDILKINNSFLLLINIEARKTFHIRSKNNEKTNKIKEPKVGNKRVNLRISIPVIPYNQKNPN